MTQKIINIHSSSRASITIEDANKILSQTKLDFDIVNYRNIKSISCSLTPVTTKYFVNSGTNKFECIDLIDAIKTYNVIEV